MKRVALLLGTLMVLGVAAGALAQQPASPGGQPGQAAPPASSKPDVDVKADVKTDAKPADRPAGDRGPNVNVNIDKKDSGSRDDGAALPRAAAGDRTTIFGLSPTAAVIVAAALLVVVILAIVAMTRSGETTYIDHDRRL